MSTGFSTGLTEEDVDDQIAATPAGTVAISVTLEDAAVAGGPHVTMNFTGSGVTISDSGSGIMDIDIPGGGSSPWTTTGTVIDYGGLEIDSAPGAACGVDYINDTGADFCNTQIGGTGSAFWLSRKAQGTIAAPTVMSDGDKIGGYGFAAYGDTGYNVNGEIASYSVGPQSDTEAGSRIVFDTTNSGSLVRVTALELAEDGDVQIPQYPDTREDGASPSGKYLFTDALGVIQSGTPKSKVSWQNSGRFYLYTDERWVTDSDDNYGFGYYQFAESGGTGVNPIQEWEHQGHMLQKGETLKKFILNARTNTSGNGVSDIDVILSFRYPDPTTRFQTGYDSDGEVTEVEILRENWFTVGNPATWGPTLTGVINDGHRRIADLDFTAPEDGWLSIYVQATGDITSQSYFLTTYRYDVEID